MDSILTVSGDAKTMPQNNGFVGFAPLRPLVETFLAPDAPLSGLLKRSIVK